MEAVLRLRIARIDGIDLNEGGREQSLCTSPMEATRR